MFHAMVRFTLILLLSLRMLAMGVNHKLDACPSKGNTRTYTPPEQVKVEPNIAILKDLLSDNIDDMGSTRVDLPRDQRG